MTSSKSSKLYREFLELESSPVFSSRVDTLFNQLDNIQNSWYYKLLPKPIKGYIDISFELIEDLEFGHRHAIAGVACLLVDLKTYKHNAKAQKAKNKTYSQLRKYWRYNVPNSQKVSYERTNS